MPKMSVTAMQQYERMLKEKFQPTISKLQEYSKELKEQLTEQAKKDLGIYQLEVKISLAKSKLEELEAQFEEYTKPSWKNGYTTKLEEAVNVRLAESDLPVNRVNKALDECLEKMWLSSAPDDIKDVFEAAMATLAEINRDAAKLPPPNRLGLPGRNNL